MDSQEQKTVLDTFNYMCFLEKATRTMIYDQHSMGDNTANEFTRIEHEIRLLHKAGNAVCNIMNISPLFMIDEGVDLRISEESWENRDAPATALIALKEVRGILNFLIETLEIYPVTASRPVPEYDAIFDGQFVNILHYMQENPHWSREDVTLSDLGYDGDDTISSYSEDDDEITISSDSEDDYEIAISSDSEDEDEITSSSNSEDEDDNPMSPDFEDVDPMIEAQPATEEDVRALKVHVAWNNEELECAICLQSIVQREVMKILPCSHIYHADCIDSWLRNSSTCPMDRFNPFAQ